MKLPYEFLIETMEAEDGGGLIVFYPTIGRGACFGRSQSGDFAELMKSFEVATASYLAFLEQSGESLPSQTERDRQFVAEAFGVPVACHLTVVNGNICAAANNNYAFAG